MKKLKNKSNQTRQVHPLLARIVNFYNAGQHPLARNLYPSLLQTDRKTLAALPYNAVVLSELAGVEFHAHNQDNAFNLLKLAIDLNGQVAAWHCNLGKLYLQNLHYQEALAACQHALKIEPMLEDGHFNAGVAYWHMGRLHQAIDCFKRVIDLNPNNATAHSNLGSIFFSLLKYNEAIENLHKSITLAPDNPVYFSSYLTALHYLKDVSLNHLYAEHLKFGERFEPASSRRFPNTPDPLRKLRIGYLSADFRSHPIAYFTEAVLKAHDKKTVEVYCYSDVTTPDENTRRLMPLAHWRTTANLSDAALTQQICKDGIDILLDMAGHTAHNRLPLFAGRAAPIQVSWIGYFDTTGLASMDYLLADDIMVPQNTAQRFTESVYRLPGGFLCYQPQPHMPEPSPPPVSTCGYITFGCFNNLNKINENVITVWSQLLNRLPNARLVLKCKTLRDIKIREIYHGLFANQGIAANRIELRGPSPHVDMLEEYADIDIALEPFPYSGGTTTVEALYMGVPVITLAGSAFVGRLSASILTSIGLDELVTDNVDEYIERIIDLASQPAKLAQLRFSMRDRISKSPLGDADLFTRNLETAFRDMWQQWCAAQTLNP